MGTASSTQATILEAAISYAERGWPVLPLVPREKRPLTQNGLLNASTDTAVITNWWRQWPHANVGLRTGVAFDVLDIDGEVGHNSLARVAGPETAHPGPISHTGRGDHWLFAPTGTANRAGLLPKLDWRGVNGYIVAPPSIHPSGHQYQWDLDHGPNSPLPQPETWLLPLLAQWVEHQPYVAPVRLGNPHDPLTKLLPTNPVRELAQQTDIIETAIRLGSQPRRDGGGRWSIPCVFHDGDREPSLKLYPHDNSFYCFGCGAWGDSYNLIDHRPGGFRGR